VIAPLHARQLGIAIDEAELMSLWEEVRVRVVM
jgi:hypothetical protein